MASGMGAQAVNPNAEVLKKGVASMMNINAARGLQDVLKTNLGPKVRGRVRTPSLPHCSLTALSRTRALAH